MMSITYISRKAESVKLHAEGVDLAGVIVIQISNNLSIQNKSIQLYSHVLCFLKLIA